MRTVLLVDDSRTSRMALAMWLAEEGWEVLEAEEGEAGLNLARQHRPDAIVCDLLMPVLNGFQFCRAIRGQTDWPTQPKLIVTTASEYETNRRNALEAGADDYLVKPVNRDKLLELLSSVPDNAEKTPAAPVVSKTAGFTPDTRVKFWGVRGSIPTPGAETLHYGGNTACVEVRADGEIVVLDAGSGLRLLGRALVAEFKTEPIRLQLLITHTHWDHIQGFPFFAPAYDPKNKVCILGVEGARTGLEGTLSSQMEGPFFPVMMDQMPCQVGIDELKDKGMEFEVGPIRGSAMFLNHPGVCVGYRLQTSKGVIAYITDHEPFERFKIETGKTSEEEIAYARLQDDKLVEFVREADILIIDSQYDRTEYPSHAGWGHGCVDDVVALALRAKARQLFLFHHDPDHDDAHITHLVEEARKLVAEAESSMKVEAAREGTEWHLTGTEARKPRADNRRTAIAAS